MINILKIRKYSSFVLINQSRPFPSLSRFSPKKTAFFFGSYSGTLGEITLTYEYLQLEPIGLAFLLFFAVVLLIQLIGMLLHR